MRRPAYFEIVGGQSGGTPLPDSVAALRSGLVQMGYRVQIGIYRIVTDGRQRVFMSIVRAHRGGQYVAELLASALGGHAVPVDRLPISHARQVALAGAYNNSESGHYVPTDSPGYIAPQFQTYTRLDFSGLNQLMANTLRNAHGGWNDGGLAVFIRPAPRIVLRFLQRKMPINADTRYNNVTRGGPSYSSVLILSRWVAWAPDMALAKAILQGVSPQLPFFSVVPRASGWSSWWTYWLVGAAGAGSLAAYFTLQHRAIWLLLGLALLGLYLAIGVLNPTLQRRWRAVRRGFYPIRWLHWFKPWRYLPGIRANNLIMFSAPQVAALLTVAQSSSVGTSAVIPYKMAAAPLVHNPGAIIGFDQANNALRVAPHDRYAGVFISGAPGSGKSTIALWMWASDIVLHQWGWPGLGCEPFRRKTVMWIETKGEGARRAYEMSVRAGAPAQLLSRDVGRVLNLVAALPPDQVGTVLADAAQYAFGSDAIAYRSHDVLTTGFTLAAAAGRQDVRYDNILLSTMALMGGSYEITEKEVLEAAKRDPSDAVDLAMQRWSTLTKQSRTFREQQLFAPALNKLASLYRIAPRFWSAAARDDSVNLDDIICGHQTVVIDLCGGLDNTSAALLSSLFMFLVWGRIKDLCRGWQSVGRSIAIYIDELANISAVATEGDLVRDMYDHGREHGVELVLATQRVGQLPPRTIDAVLSMGTKVYLQQESAQVAQQLAADIFGPDEAATQGVQVIRDLPNFVGWLRAKVGGQQMPPCTLFVRPDAQFDLNRFPEAQWPQAAQVAV